MMVLSEAYEEEDLGTPEKADSRVVLRFPPRLAPVKLAIFPLLKKDGLPEIARKVLDECKPSFDVSMKKRTQLVNAIVEWTLLEPLLRNHRSPDERRQHCYHQVPGFHAAGKNTGKRG
jgi:hypothetical protein